MTTTIQLTDAQLLGLAADHLELVGLNQDGNYFEGGAMVSEAEGVRCCTIGAVLYATRGISKRYTNLYDKWLRTTHVELHPDALGIINWSDRDATTDEAVAFLRAAAAKARAAEGVSA